MCHSIKLIVVCTNEMYVNWFQGRQGQSWPRGYGRYSRVSRY